MRGSLVRYDNEGHTGIGWQVVEQFLECFEPSRRSTYANDRKRFGDRFFTCQRSSCQEIPK